MSASRKTIAVLGVVLLVTTLSGCANDEGDDDRTPSISSASPSPTETPTPNPSGTVDADDPDAVEKEAIAETANTYWGIIESAAAEAASEGMYEQAAHYFEDSIDYQTLTDEELADLAALNPAADYIYLEPGQDKKTEYFAIMKVAAHMSDPNTKTRVSNPEQIQVFGDDRAVIPHSATSVEYDNEPVQMTGEYALVLTKQDGKWLVNASESYPM